MGAELSSGAWEDSCQGRKSCPGYSVDSLSSPHSTQTLPGTLDRRLRPYLGGERLGGEFFQSHTHAGSKAPATQSHPGEGRWACCLLPLNSDWTVQTRHLQLFTVETEKERNLDKDFVFKVRHIQNPASLCENIHCSAVCNSKRLKPAHQWEAASPRGARCVRTAAGDEGALQARPGSTL